MTQLLREIEAGETSAKERLFEAVHTELRAVAAQLMRRERTDHTLQPTALVNEAALRLLGESALGRFRGREHFLGAMANAMKRVLVDHARKRKAARRGGDRNRVALDEAVCLIEEARGIDLVELDEAIEELRQLNPRQGDVVVRRFFGGFEVQEIADQLEVSISTIEKDWRIAKIWLRRRLSAGENE